MKRGDWAVEHGVLRASTRFGVIRAATLEQLGISQRTTYRQCLPGGRWRRLLPGIVMLSRGQPTQRQRIEAALMHARHTTALTGFAAARLYGLTNLPADDSIHLLVPHDHRICSSGFAVVERTRYFPAVVRRDGIPLAPPARAVLDGVRRIREVEPVRALLVEAVQKGLCSPAELTCELDSGSRRGTALPRRVLGEIDAGIRSVAEGDSLAIWRRAGLPPAHRNVTLLDSAGVFVGIPDSWCDEVGLAWEIDSFQFHYNRDDYARTLRRNTRYAAAGIVVVQTLPSRLRTEPDAVVAELRAAYAAARKRPRPPVVITPAGAA